MKWNQRCYFCKGAEFLGHSLAEIFFKELAKLWQKRYQNYSRQLEADAHSKHQFISISQREENQ
jgi:hypothetical protein